MPKMLIGTPDQLVDLFIEKKVDSTGIRVMVLDEADMLLDDSHRESIERLLAKIRPAQRLVFTATMKEHQVAETYRFVGADEIVDVDKKRASTGTSRTIWSISSTAIRSNRSSRSSKRSDRTA